MRLSAEKLRWILLGGAVLLACVVAAVFGMANYRAGQIWRRILARNGVNLRRETNGFTYSQSDGKRTIFTLHAAKAVPRGKDRWSLSDAILVLYAKDGRTDRIYGREFDYDQSAGIARAVGEVHMDLQAPPSAGHGGSGGAPNLGFTPGDEAAADPGLIHVRTNGLVYVRKLGVAATDQATEFRYRGLTCTSRGAEFDSEQNVVRLLADVHVNGDLRGDPFTLTASHAVLDRSRNQADLQQPVLFSGERHARASHALLHLRADGSLNTGDADGDVELSARTQTLRAPRLHGDFGPQNQVRHALFSGGVAFADTLAAHPAQGTARDVDLNFSDAGLLSTAMGDGGLNLLTEARTADGAVSQRIMKAQTGLASFAPERGRGRQVFLQSLHLKGDAVVTGRTPPGGGAAHSTDLTKRANLTEVRADDLQNTFAQEAFAQGRARQSELQETVGTGHTQLEQMGSDGQHQLSTGERLELHFSSPNEAPAGRPELQLASAIQTGHVVLRSWSGVSTPAGSAPGKRAPERLTVGHADRALFASSAGTLTLTGGFDGRADAYDGTTQLSAPTIVLHQGSGDGEASGGVIATTGGEGDAAATHILSSRADLLHSANQTRFFGTDAQPARLWQNSSQVEAATLVLDGRQHTLSARPEGQEGSVHAIFSNTRPSTDDRAPRTQFPPASSVRVERPKVPAASETQLPRASRDAIDVRAATMDYNEEGREATLNGKVSLRGPAGDVTGDHGAVFLQPASAGARNESGDRAGVAEVGGRLERFVLVGNVRLLQPGRNGTGNQLTYTAATERFSLTGTPGNQPRIHDAQQGTVTGTTLLFSTADSSIVVSGATPPRQAAGASGEKPAKAPRVHTETDLKQP